MHALNVQPDVFLLHEELLAKVAFVAGSLFGGFDSSSMGIFVRSDLLVGIKVPAAEFAREIPLTLVPDDARTAPAILGQMICEHLGSVEGATTPHRGALYCLQIAMLAR